MSLSDKFTIIIPPQDISCEPGLLEKLACGDREAFAWIYKNYSKKVYNYAFLFTGNAAESDDIVQDIFIRLWKGRKNLKSVKNFNAYLNVMARNYVTDFIGKKEKYRANIKEYGYFTEKFAQQKDATTEYWCDKIELLEKGIETLPPQQKTVSRMRWNKD